MTVRRACALFLVASLGCGSDGPAPEATADGGAPADGAVDDWTAGIVDLPATGPAASVATLTDLRWAGHAAYDRVTLEFEGAALPAIHLEYIDRPVRRCGSGHPTPIEGDGWLEVRLSGAAAHDEAGAPTITERESFPHLGNLWEIEITCDFEAEVVVVLGVGSPNPYRALVLDRPARLAVDVRR
ncbi:MAG TPA: hypothetical protein VK837_05970 [Longimicrobiales bacterium]|nr:hypothetical protein [Longimicrobiales bacterium]